MNQPSPAELETAPTPARVAVWLVLLVVLVSGIFLYFRFGSAVNPLLYLEPAR